jgi:hypothetical protein
MSTKAHRSSDSIDEYIMKHSLRLTSEQKEIIEYTKTLEGKYFLFDYREEKHLEFVFF